MEEIITMLPPSSIRRQASLAPRQLARSRTPNSKSHVSIGYSIEAPGRGIPGVGYECPQRRIPADGIERPNEHLLFSNVAYDRHMPSTGQLGEGLPQVITAPVDADDSAVRPPPAVARSPYPDRELHP